MPFLVIGIIGVVFWMIGSTNGWDATFWIWTAVIVALIVGWVIYDQYDV
ncbi:hypothetical protein [Nocardia sp. NPDC059239]